MDTESKFTLDQGGTIHGDFTIKNTSEIVLQGFNGSATLTIGGDIINERDHSCGGLSRWSYDGSSDFFLEKQAGH